MKTRILKVNDIKDIWAEMFLNKVGGKVTKISDNSVMNAMAYGISSVALRAMKDSALMEAQIFPEYTYGDDSDVAANRYGIPTRYMATGSSTFLRLVGETGTEYNQESVIFETDDGMRFRLSENVKIGPYGYEYVFVKSDVAGSNANVDPNTITKCTNAPVGHKYCTNEFMAMGGRDTEDDLGLKTRISKFANIHATDTLSRLEQILMSINPNVFNLKKVGRDSKGIIKIAVHSQNGGLFDPDELDQFQRESKRFLSLTDVGFGFPGNVRFINGLWKYIDFDFRAQLSKDTDIEELRKGLQMMLSQFFDWRRWDYSGSIRWIDLFNVCKNQDGMKYLPDQHFYPKTDTTVVNPYLPRIRGFIMRDLDGIVLLNNETNIDPVTNELKIMNPVYYEHYMDSDYISVAISNL